MATLALAPGDSGQARPARGRSVVLKECPIHGCPTRLRRTYRGRAWRAANAHRLLDPATRTYAVECQRHHLERQGQQRHLAEAGRAATLRSVAPTVSGLEVGDFRDLAARRLAADSVHLVLTDPPYDDIDLYAAIGREASRVLRPGGSLIAYAGQKYLPALHAVLSEHLRYWWTLALIHEGRTQLLQKLGVRCAWKPLLWFVKGTRGDVQAVARDVVVGGGREKDAHVWQQAEAEACALIERFTRPGELVVDFCAGSGTVLVAAKRAGRQYVGFERDPATARSAATRLSDGPQECGTVLVIDAPAVW